MCGLACANKSASPAVDRQTTFSVLTLCAVFCKKDGRFLSPGVNSLRSAITRGIYRATSPLTTNKTRLPTGFLRRMKISLKLNFAQTCADSPTAQSCTTGVASRCRQFRHHSRKGYEVTGTPTSQILRDCGAIGFFERSTKSA